MRTDEPVGEVPGSFLVSASVYVFWDRFSGEPGDLGG